MKASNNLIVIKRHNDSFTTIFYEKRIERFCLRSSKKVNGFEDRWILYYTTENGKVKKTNFCELCASSMEQSRSLVQKNLHKERNALRYLLDNAQKERRKKLYSLIQRHKFLSKTARASSDPDEASPLVRFGSIFLRTCNERVVVGIPILNISQ